MSVRAVAHFERKGWPLRPYCYENSSKAKTAAAQQKLQAAARGEERGAAAIAGGGASAQGRNRCPRQHGEEYGAEEEEVAPTSAQGETEAGG